MQMSQSIFGRGFGGDCSVVMCASSDILSVVVNRAIQLAWNKNGSISFIIKSKKKKNANECIIFPPHNSFSVDPSTEMFTDSYHSSSFSHLRLDMFQKTGPFHLPSRCEEICSLMAFKTGSTDNKKRRSEKNAPTSPHTLESPLQLTHPLRSGVLRHSGAAAKVPTVPVTLTSICRQLDTISPTAAHSCWIGTLSHSEVWMPFKAQARNCVSTFVCYCILCSQLLCKKKTFITKLNTKRVALRNAQRNTLLPMCKSLHYQAN